MAKAKSDSVSSPSSTASSTATNSPSNLVLMSPRPTTSVTRTSNGQPDIGLTTPTQDGQVADRPWQKYAPSPCDASPSAGILKRTSASPNQASTVVTDEGVPPVKRRRVQFMDPPVSEQVTELSLRYLLSILFSRFFFM